MSKRVKIAVIREATLNAKPTDTHYLAEGGLQISRRDARALKGTTLYYEVLVDLGEVKGFDFVPGRDIPVYQTDSEPVLALDPQSLRLVDSVEGLVKKFQEFEQAGPITMHSQTVVDHSTPLKNAVMAIKNAAESVPGECSVEVKSSHEFHSDGTPQNVSVNVQLTPEAPAKRRPGRPKKVVVEVPISEPVPTLEPEVTEGDPTDFKPVAVDFKPVAVDFTSITDFQGTTEKQDDESTFLIDPESVAPTPAPVTKPEFSFEVDEDEAPPPPPVRNSTPQNLGFEVEDEETPAAAAATAPAEKPTPNVTASVNTDDFADVEPGLFDE